MLLCTEHGFFSIVQKEDSEFHIRARRRKDLENFRRMTGIRWQIKVTRDADYRYRLTVSKETAIGAVALLMDSVNYPSLRERVAANPEQRGKLPYYEALCEGMRSFQPKDRSAKPK